MPRDVLKARKYLEELNLNVNMIEQLPLVSRAFDECEENVRVNRRFFIVHLQELFRCTKLKKLDVSEVSARRIHFTSAHHLLDTSEIIANFFRTKLN